MLTFVSVPPTYFILEYSPSATAVLAISFDYLLFISADLPHLYLILMFHWVLFSNLRFIWMICSIVICIGCHIRDGLCSMLMMFDILVLSSIFSYYFKIVCVHNGLLVSRIFLLGNFINLLIIFDGYLRYVWFVCLFSLVCKLVNYFVILIFLFIY